MAGEIELYTLTFQTGSILKSRPHPPKTEEFLTVTSGRILVQAGSRQAELGEEDFIRYHADIDHSIRNIGDGPAVVNMMVRFSTKTELLKDQSYDIPGEMK
jgi:quercetin dioxygenase-like cupin family protein